MLFMMSNASGKKTVVLTFIKFVLMKLVKSSEAK